MVGRLDALSQIARQSSTGIAQSTGIKPTAQEQLSDSPCCCISLQPMASGQQLGRMGQQQRGYCTTLRSAHCTRGRYIRGYSTLRPAAPFVPAAVPHLARPILTHQPALLHSTLDKDSTLRNPQFVAAVPVIPAACPSTTQPPPNHLGPSWRSPHQPAQAYLLCSQPPHTASKHQDVSHLSQLL